MDVQKRIKELMLERGWSAYRLAKESGLAHSTIANIFTRNNLPTLPTLEAVCNAFGITLMQFFTDEDSPSLFTDEQQQLLAKWSTLSEDKKEALLHLMNIM